jgi:hypothetical protein
MLDHLQLLCENASEVISKTTIVTLFDLSISYETTFLKLACEHYFKVTQQVYKLTSLQCNYDMLANDKEVMPVLQEHFSELTKVNYIYNLTNPQKRSDLLSMPLPIQLEPQLGPKHFPAIVRVLTGETFTISIKEFLSKVQTRYLFLIEHNLDYQIATVKLRIAARTSIHPDYQQLCYAGVRLEDHRTVADYSILYCVLMMLI